MKKSKEQITFRQNFKILRWGKLSILMLAFAALLFFLPSYFLMSETVKSFLQCISISSNNFDKMFISDTPVSKNHSIYINRDILTHKLEHAYSLSCNCTLDLSLIMQTQGNELKSDEIILSYNAATKFDIALNQKLYAKIYGEQSKTYTVVGISPPSYGIVSNDYSSDGVGIIGFDAEYISKNSIEYICFMNEDENITSSMPFIIKSVKNSQLFLSAVLRFAFGMLGLLVVFCGCSVVGFAFREVKLRQRIIKCKYLGLSISRLKFLIFFDCLLIAIGFFLLGIVGAGLSCLSLGEFGLFCVLLLVVVEIVGTCLMSLIRGKYFWSKKCKQK